MTTKYKIITGFALMTVLIAVLAVLGYRSTVSSADGFVEYRRQVWINIATSDMVSQMYNIIGHSDKFVRTEDRTQLTEADKALQKALGYLNTARELSNSPESKNNVAEVSKRVEVFKGLIADLGNAIVEEGEQYTSSVLQSVEALQAAFTRFTQASARAQDVSGLVLLSSALNDLASARASIARYAVTRTGADQKIALDSLAAMRDSIEGIKVNVVSEGGWKLMNALTAAADAYIGSFNGLVTRAEKVNALLADMDARFQVELEELSALSEQRDHSMRELGAQMLAESENVKTLMLIIGVGGLLLGMAVALVIVLGLISVLKRMSQFALDVAAGRFDVSAPVREGGEIGAMVQAMQSIPRVITSVMDNAKDLARTILAGNYRERLHPGDFVGGFGDLAETFNTVSNAYTNVLDMLPLPIKTCDTGKRIRFLNKAGQESVGGNPVGELCANHIRSAVCGTENCLGGNSLRSNGRIAGETTMHPGGRDEKVECSVVAIPIHDEQGAAVGYIEIFTDITDVKEKQAIIVNVANQASEIADRVAAASEEIAAQVEQISRGAEVQCERVETTASAMAEMNSTVMEVARNAGQASDQSHTTKEQAEGGATLVSKVVTAISAVNTLTQSMQANMLELGEQAEQVGGVMNVISDIADQTNLLALNAAIEAARAGEAGRGFAVVADEVRKLAEKTMSATQEVGANITAIQDSTRRNISAMQDAAKGVAEATDLATSSGSALSEIVSLASDNSSVVASIATAAEQQSATSEEINRAIEEINKIVSETSDGMTQSSQAVQELSHMTQELRTIIDSLR